MSYSTGKGAGQFLYRLESTLGTSAAAWKCLRPEEPPTIKTCPRTTIKVPSIGHRNPFDIGEAPPVLAPAAIQAGAVSYKTAQYLAAAGVLPSIVQMIQSSGLVIFSNLQAPGFVLADITTATPTTTAVKWEVIAASTKAAGQCFLVELATGVYFPFLIADTNADVQTPYMALPSAPAVGADVIQMYSFSPKTETTFEIADGLSLQFAWQGLPLYEDLLGDLNIPRSACVLESLKEISIPGFGQKFLFDFSFYGLEMNLPDDTDMAADSFHDLGVPLIMNQDCEFGFGAADHAGGITRAVMGVKDVKINLGLSVQPVPFYGGGGIGGVQCFHQQYDTPTITFTAGFDASFKPILDAMVGANTPVCIHLVQPTRSPATAPAFGFWAPRCILSPGEPISVELHDDIVTFTATYDMDINKMYLTDDEHGNISDIHGQPWFLAFSGIPAAV